MSTYHRLIRKCASFLGGNVDTSLKLGHSIYYLTKAWIREVPTHESLPADHWPFFMP